MPGLSSTGFEAKTLEDIQNEIKQELYDNISPTLNLGSESLLGQAIGSISSQIRQVWEGIADTYAARDIDQAEGDALTGLCRLRGTTRTGATYSTVLMTVTLAAGTYAAGSLVVHVVGDPAARFDNDEEITTAGATITDVPFTALETGPVRANAGTLTVIANPVSGFSSPTNPAEAILGEDEESDADLRARSAVELARRGAHTVDAIRVDLLDIDGVEYVSVLENDTDVTVDGMPPHSIECVVLHSLTDQEILDAIFEAKPAGIQAYGSTTGTVVDDQGNSHDVAYTEPTPVQIFIDLDLTVLSGGRYAGDTAVKEAITDWCDANLTVGRDVIKSRIESLCLGVEGVIDATAEIGLSSGAGTSPANYVIDTREIATVDQGDIAIVQNVVDGEP